MIEVHPLLEAQIKAMPDMPGVYQYYDKNGGILYVGKAKNLKKRVYSYFSKIHEHKKTRILVSKITRIEHIVVETETDALLLESNLIKRLQPPYNILLKDDKSYPWICIKNEPFPRVFYTRKIIRDGSQYFGPYTNIKTVFTLLDLIKELYPLRTCVLDLSQEHIEKHKYKVCLEYHIQNCQGPCQAFETKEQYNQKIKAITNILKGNFKDNLKAFEEHMHQLASNLEFEKAQEIKEKIALLSNYQSKSTVVNAKIANVNVFSIISDDESAYVNYFQVIHGAIIGSHTMEIKKKLDETNSEILRLAVSELRNRFHLTSKELILPFEIETDQQLIQTIPKTGDKKLLLDLSERNAKYYRLDKLKQIKIIDPQAHTNRILQQIKKDLYLSELPKHMECFDNSNIQGTNPVAACVVFKEAKPSKKEYRHFNIKTVEGPNDFASMEEVVYRRYKRLLDEKESLPQLIIIDGGKGQLSSALKSLDRLNLRGKIAIIGIAKRLEEIYFPGDSLPLYLDKKSETLKIIQHMRNEAHRFGITFHRSKRSKSAISSGLTQIPGIGEKTMQKLMTIFKSVKRIKETPIAELEKVIGKDKAQKIVTHFKD